MKQWSDDMGEISGFGGDYEATCRSMVLAGIKWFDEHPDASPRFHGYEGVTGIVVEDNEDAAALTAAIVAPASGDCTGAMHHAAVAHVLAYKRLGWDEYCRQLRGRQG